MHAYLGASGTGTGTGTGAGAGADAGADEEAGAGEGTEAAVLEGTERLGRAISFSSPENKTTSA